MIDNVKTAVKLFGGFAIVIVLMIVIGVIGVTSTRSSDLGMENMYFNHLLPAEELGIVQAEVYRTRGDSYRYLLVADERLDTYSEMQQSDALINEAMAKYKATDLVQSEVDSVAGFDAAYQEYINQVHGFIQLVDAGNENGALAMLLNGGAVANASTSVDTAIDNLLAVNTQEAERIKAENEITFRNGWIAILATVLIGILFSIVTAFTITKSINKPLQIMTNALKKLQLGIISHDTDEKTKKILLARKDEMGEALTALAATEDYLTDMSHVADTIANNDLTAEFKPKSQQDQLGSAFLRMTSNLLNTVKTVGEMAGQVSEASDELASAANQAGQATSQIATTIQQVAKGTTQQTEGVNKTASSVDEMARAIDGVARGAQEQATAAAKASTITGQLSSAIDQVAGNAQAVVHDSANAADAARRGSKTVEKTLQGMRSIKEAVGISAEKVQEMGSRSDQIGDIVTTIDDIASQTNLLALNAAIEAARAGEAGKGFAVVADEVRKLAERSSSATKEIGGLIRGIQGTVSEAVTAMANGAREVESGVEFANQAGDALEEILKASEAVNEQAEQAAAAAEQMSASANELVGAVDSVSAVVEENTAATEEMAASSSEVTQAIEGIASVSEENSAAVEEVSASAEEMTAQVEEVSASAQELSTLAQQLNEIVAQFKTQDNDTQNLAKECAVFIQAHKNWVARARRILEDVEKIAESETPSHLECSLGRWYYGLGQHEYGSLKQFQDLGAPHQKFHDLLKQFVAAKNHGNTSEAQSYFEQLEKQSHEVSNRIQVLQSFRKEE